MGESANYSWGNAGFSNHVTVTCESLQPGLIWDATGSAAGAGAEEDLLGHAGHPPQKLIIIIIGIFEYLKHVETTNQISIIYWING